MSWHSLYDWESFLGFPIDPSECLMCSRPRLSCLSWLIGADSKQILIMILTYRVWVMSYFPKGFSGWLSPSTNAVILSIISVSKLVHLWNMRHVENSNYSFASCGEDDSIMRIIGACHREEWPSVPSKGYIRLRVTFAFFKLLIQTLKAPQLHSAVLWDWDHWVDVLNK